jgi:hypothetical protein
MSCADNYFSTTSANKIMSQVYLNLNISRHFLVYRYIRVWIKLRYLFMDGGSSTYSIHKRISTSCLNLNIFIH